MVGYFCGLVKVFIFCLFSDMTVQWYCFCLGHCGHIVALSDVDGL